MQVFLINLARRCDRLESMTAQLARLGLQATRIPALDARSVSSTWLANFFAPRGPLGIIPKGDQCCSLSHRRAWAAFLASDAPYATVLEDDVILDPAASSFLRRTDWIGPGVDLVKLEHFGPESQRVLVGEPRDIGSGHAVAPILSRHTGAGAYVLSRRAAQLLMRVEQWNVPVDHLLFNPNVSPLPELLEPVQMLPAIARQGAGTSDIRQWRLADRRLGLKLARREIVRAYYELRLLPRQVAAVLRGQARLMRVGGPQLLKLDHPVHTLRDLISARTGTV